MILGFPSLAEMEARLQLPDLSNMKKMKLAVLRNVSMEPLEPYLRYLASGMGFDAEVKFGNFDTVMQDAIAGAPDLLTGDLDAVLIFTPIDVLSWAIARNFSALDGTSLSEERERLAEYFDVVVKGVRRQTDATILWHGLESPIYPSFGIGDAGMAEGQRSTVSDINRTLRLALASVPNAFHVDMEACLARVGANDFYDLRFWHTARAPYGRKALAEIAQEDFKFLRSLKGLAKKCLVLDCDDTLWGGVVGEEGLSGIALGKNYPGSAFLEFQQEVVSLFNRGVIVALCSKNNEADVWDVFDNHPDMLLKRKHVAAWRINWNDKAANIRELAQELNIGLDSMVFIEDSPFEANLVQSEVPEVATLLFPRDRPTEYRRLLASCGLFDAATITSEDRKRGEMYQKEIGRRKSQSEAADIGEYLKSLEMKMTIGAADSFTVPRIAQMTQKTNQFNLTTRRYTEADIARFVGSADHQVVWLKVADKLGDLGIVGTCIIRHDGDLAQIDTLLMSCRALGRGVEQKFGTEILDIARKSGARRVRGEFIATKKNQLAEGFLEAIGFERVAERNAGETSWELDLANLPDRDDGHFALVDNQVAGARRVLVADGA